MPDLSKIGIRGKLKPKRGDEPHWHRLRAGCYLGFRPSRKAGPGGWVARVYDPDTLKYRRKLLGDYGSMTGHDVFAAAKRDAEAWAEQVETGGLREEGVETVSDACRAYLKSKPDAIAEGVFRRHVFSDPISGLKLDKLRKHHLLGWRERLEETPALISRNKRGEKRTKQRSPATINRDMVPLRAALGRLLPLGSPNTNAAWQEALKPIKGAGKRRSLYLDRSERKSLLDAIQKDAEPFVRALCLLPLRPGAVAALTTQDFDQRTRTLTIGKDKSSKTRQITVPGGLATFLAKQTEDKKGAEPIFTGPDGIAWSKDKWKRPIKEAVVKADLPHEATAYTLRHSVITDLVRGGLPILTIAQLAGTSVAMIEKHYGHLVRHDAEVALAGLEL